MAQAGTFDWAVFSVESAVLSGAMTRDYGYYRDALRGERLPAAFLDVELLDLNIESIAGRAKGRPIRVASKSVRCTWVLRRILSSSGYRGVMAYTAAEAAFLAGEGFDDILVAYPTLEAAEVRAVLARIRSGSTIVLMVDDVEQVRRLAELAKGSGVVLSLCIDVDMSSRFPGLHFGVRRSPITTAQQALAVAGEIARDAHLRLDGLMGYEAQIAGLPDAVRARRASSVVVRALKRRSFGEIAARRAAIVDALRREGHALRFVNGGGTGSLEATTTDASVTECTAGSGFYSPALFDEFHAFRHHPAAAFAVPVTRRPAPDLFACHGGGYVASGAAGPDKLPRPYLPEGFELLSQEGAGEVQTPFRYVGPERLALGDPIIFRHAKAGELCERFDRLALVRDRRVVEHVPTYRGQGQCFL